MKILWIFLGLICTVFLLYGVEERTNTKSTTTDHNIRSTLRLENVEQNLGKKNPKYLNISNTFEIISHCLSLDSEPRKKQLIYLKRAWQLHSNGKKHISDLSLLFWVRIEWVWIDLMVNLVLCGYCLYSLTVNTFFFVPCSFECEILIRKISQQTTIHCILHRLRLEWIRIRIRIRIVVCAFCFCFSLINSAIALESYTRTYVMYIAYRGCSFSIVLFTFCYAIFPFH